MENNHIFKFIKRTYPQPHILRPEYLTTDGVYRQSGNLSVVQRLRLQIDQGNLAVLDTVDDVHVLTGALKLFFRELQEPLIPWEVGCSALLDPCKICPIHACKRNKANICVICPIYA